MNCLDIITRAMRRIGILAAGQLPRDIESQDALDTLSAIYARLISEGAFGEIRSLNASASMTAGENQRIILSDLNVIVTLPETISDFRYSPYPDDNFVTSYSGDVSTEVIYDLGLMAAGGMPSGILVTVPAPRITTAQPRSIGRPIRDGAVVAIINHVTNTRNTYIRDAQAGIWLDIDNLDLTAEAPLSRRDPTGLSCYLAVELADEYGQQPSEIAVFNAGRWQRSLTHNYSEPSPPSRGVYF